MYIISRMINNNLPIVFSILWKSFKARHYGSTGIMTYLAYYNFRLSCISQANIKQLKLVPILGIML